MCFHAEFGRSALKYMGIDTGEPPNWGALKLRFLGMGGVDDFKIYIHTPTCVTTSNQICEFCRATTGVCTVL